MAKKILFVCATGIATSTVATEKTLEYLRERNVDVDYVQVNVSALGDYHEGDADLIVATTQVPYETGIPVVHALPLITGIGEDDTLEEIYEAIE